MAFSLVLHVPSRHGAGEGPRGRGSILLVLCEPSPPAERGLKVIFLSSPPLLTLFVPEAQTESQGRPQPWASETAFRITGLSVFGGKTSWGLPC